MSSNDLRAQRAEAVALSRIVTSSSGYLVPSQGNAGRHTVNLDPPSCTCPDFELRAQPCKHILGVQLWLERRDLTKDDPSPPPEPPPKVPRKTYAQQDWAAYHAAQVNEWGHFLDLLADLCRTIPEPPRTGKGRRPIPLADQVFAATLKVYSLFSARRFMGHLEEAHGRGHVSRSMHFNSVLNALENEALTPILVDLIQRSGLPLRSVERQFAVDSSGFATSRFIRWFDIKYNVTRDKAEWVKCHVCVGTKTHIVTGIEILEKDAADVSQLPELVNQTARRYIIDEVSADMAYPSNVNFAAVAAHGATLYAPFKSNATGAVGGLFEQMFHYFCLRREEFLEHYNRRANVESVFSMVKRKFGDSVRSKTDTAMKNECLCKLLAHNICCLIASWYELGIEPIFGGTVPEETPDILPFVRPG